MKKVYIALAAIILTGLIACSDSESGKNEISAYSLAGTVGIINEEEKTISVEVPYNADVTALIATFTTTGARVNVGAMEQISGTTINNFTSPLIYTVTAEDGSKADYTVTVTLAPSPEKAITAYSLAGFVGTINEEEKTISVEVPYDTDVTALIATFTTTGASLIRGSTDQISGATPNNFTSPVVYKVIADDKSTVNYTVTVDVEKVNWVNAQWVKVASSTEFCPRDSAQNAVLHYNNALWILEGYRYNGWGKDYASSSDVWSSINGHDWTLINANPPYGPYNVFIAFNDYMWAFGGKGSYRSWDGLNWELIASPPFNPMRGTLFHDKIWILDTSQRVWSSENGFAWTLIADQTPWPAREWPGWLSLNGRLWLFGGGGAPYNKHYDIYYTDVWASEDGKHWSLITSSAPFTASYWSGFAVYNNKLWILGGFKDWNSANYGNVNDVWFSADGVQWEKQTNVQWSPRHAMFVWVAENRLWISSGYSGNNDIHNDVWKLQLP